MMDNEVYKHTLRLCNYYCFSTATVVTRTLLYVTSVITNLGVRLPPEVRTRIFRATQKKMNNGRKMRICQQLQFTITIYNSNYINYKHFANMKGTLCKIGLPRGTEVKKKIFEPLCCIMVHCLSC
jgi:hypothetical protein